MGRSSALLLAAAMLAVLAAPAGAATSSDVRRLQSAECPGEYRTVLELPPYTADQVEDALDWRFELIERKTRLEPPVNWDKDPYDSRSWTARLHSWTWIDILLKAYVEDGNRQALARARGLALDWIKRNPRGPRLPWSDKVTGDRAGYLAYATRAAACEGKLSDSQAARLLDAARQHGAYLTNDRNYSPSNHGLFMDAGLILLGDYLSFLGPADRWQDHAWARTTRAYRKAVQWREGVHLEHSPHYHYVVYKILDTLLDVAREPDDELLALRDRMRAIGGWFAMADGLMLQFGDTPREPAPEWAKEGGRGLRGISPTRRSGYAVVKPNADDYFAVTAGYHSAAHKQADELHFELYQQGERVLLDTGRYGFERDKSDSDKVKAREYTLANRAHSTLAVDRRNFHQGERNIYGSGIEATGVGDGWYAVEAVNPLLRRQGVAHRRFYLYRPAEALVVVDQVKSDDRHEYRRYFQFGTDIAVDKTSSTTYELSAGAFRGALRDAPTGSDAGRRIVKGQGGPMLGWYTTGGWKGFRERSTAVFDSEAKNVQHTTALALDGTEPLSADIGQVGVDGATVSLHRAGEPTVEVTARTDGHRMTVTDSRFGG